MNARSRDVVVTAVTSCVYFAITLVLAHETRFLHGVVNASDPPGSRVLVHLLISVPYLVVTFAAGICAASALRPRGDTQSIAVLGGLVALAFSVSSLAAIPMTWWLAEDLVGVLLVSSMLSGCILLCGRIIRRRASRRQLN
jgi:hypothetical protein